MKVDGSNRKTDRVVVFSLVVALAACVVGALSMGDASSDTSIWPDIPAASVAAPVPAPDAGPIARASQNTKWYADESAEGTRPDESH